VISLTGNDAHSDALRFHVCLLSENGSPPTVHARELTDTVQLFLIDELERWSDGVLHQWAGAAGAGPLGLLTDVGLAGGAADRLLGTAPHEVRQWLSPRSFAPERATGAFLCAVVEARRDQRRIAAARLLRPAARRARLLSHLELLATLAVVIRPVMPGWSAFVAGHLGMARDAHWPPASDDRRLLSPHAPLRPGLPGYFAVPPVPPVL
jgi:methionyl-tRNA synthetase